MKSNKDIKRTSIGGQALIEGLMMVGPDKKATAIRLPNGAIKVETSPISKPTGLAAVPLVRGSVRLVRQMIEGTKDLMYSAELQESEEAAAVPVSEDDPDVVPSSESTESDSDEMSTAVIRRTKVIPSWIRRTR